jgi:hypothetical protein
MRTFIVHSARFIVQSAIFGKFANSESFYTSAFAPASCVFSLSYGTPDAIRIVHKQCRTAKTGDRHIKRRPRRLGLILGKRGQIVSSNAWSKLVAISWALAAAGVLACAGALLDAFMPRGSFFGVLAWLAVLGILVIGTVIGYTWITEKCEKHFDERIDRLLDVNNGKKTNKEKNP